MKKIELASFLIFTFLLLFPQEITPFFKQAKSWILGYQSEHSFYEFSAAPSIEIHVEALEGDISVQGWSLPSVAIEVVKEGPAQTVSDVQISYSATPSQCQITTEPTEAGRLAAVSYRLMVPKNAHLVLKNETGCITVKQVSGMVSIFSDSGRVALHGVSGALFVHAGGPIEASLSGWSDDSSIEFSTKNGGINLVTNGIINASLLAQTVVGTISSDQSVSLLACTMPLNKESWYYLQRNIRGSLGHGGGHIKLYSYGDIAILEH